jgi:hypothetical protein
MNFWILTIGALCFVMLCVIAFEIAVWHDEWWKK